MLASVKRVWQKDSGKLIVLYVILNCEPLVGSWVAGERLQAPFVNFFVWFAIEAFLAWRIYRGGMNSWALLFALTAWSLLIILLGTTWPWDASVYAVGASVVGQMILLCSPAVRGRLQVSQIVGRWRSQRG